MKFKLEFDMDNESLGFTVPHNSSEIMRIVKTITDDMSAIVDYMEEPVETSNAIRDFNGKAIGKWEITDEP